MARNRSAQAELEKLAPAHEDPPAPRRPHPRLAPAGDRGRLRWALRGALGLCAVSAGLLAFYHLDRQLASHPRFLLPAEPGAPDDRRLDIQGAHYSPPREIVQVFAADFGRSVYLVPLEERRRQLMTIDWVRQAAVKRHWPNRLAVHIVERTPVAFVLLPEAGPESPRRPVLMDSEGVLLRPPERGQFDLPVLFGVSERQSRDERRRSVNLMLRLLEEAGEHASEIAEVDVSDTDNITLTLSLGGRTVELWMGRENFGTRLKNFFDNYASMRQQKPEADLFDLRVDGQIAAAPGRPYPAGRARLRAGSAVQRSKDAH